MINQTYIQPYIPLGILVVFVIMDLIYIASKHGQNTSPSATQSAQSSQKSISPNSFLHTYFPTIVLIVVIIISLLVMFSILGIDFNKKLPEHVSKIVTYNSVI